MLKEYEKYINGPDFIFVGPLKSATSTLLKTLKLSGLKVPLSNEIYFHSKDFSTNFDGPYDKAKKKIWTCRWNENEYDKFYKTNNISAEVATDYFHHPEDFLRSVARLKTKPKIIVSYRNPIDRSLSQYKHMLIKGHEWLSLEKAVKFTEGRLLSGYRWGYDYLTPSNYSQFITFWKNNFDTYIFNFENYKKSPINEINKLSQWMNIDLVNKKIHINKKNPKLFNFFKNFNSLDRSEIEEKLFVAKRWCNNVYGDYFEKCKLNLYD